MRIAFHVVRQPRASVPPRPRPPKSQGAWARTAPASRLAVQSVAAIRLRKKDVVPMPASSCHWICRRGVVGVFLKAFLLQIQCETFALLRKVGSEYMNIQGVVG